MFVQKKIIIFSLCGMLLSLLASIALYAANLERGGWFAFGADLALGIFSGLIVSLATAVIFYFDERKRFDLGLCGAAAKASNYIGEFYSAYLLNIEYGDLEGCFEECRKLRAAFTAMHNSMAVNECHAFYAGRSANRKTIDRFLSFLSETSKLCEDMVGYYYRLLRPGLSKADKDAIVQTQEFHDTQQKMEQQRNAARGFIGDFADLSRRKARKQKG